MNNNTFIALTTFMISWSIITELQEKERKRIKEKIDIRKKYISLGICLGRNDFDKADFQQIHSFNVNEIEKCQKHYFDFIQSYISFKKIDG